MARITTHSERVRDVLGHTRFDGKVVGMVTRRNFCAGLAGLVAAPFVIRASGVLMPVADRNLGSYTINGHDAFGRRISEEVYVAQKTMMELHRMDMRSPEYAKAVDGIFTKAFSRGTLADYNLYSVGRFFEGKPTAIIRVQTG